MTDIHRIRRNWNTWRNGLWPRSTAATATTRPRGPIAGRHTRTTPGATTRPPSWPSTATLDHTRANVAAALDRLDPATATGLDQAGLVAVEHHWQRAGSWDATTDRTRARAYVRGVWRAADGRLGRHPCPVPVFALDGPISVGSAAQFGNRLAELIQTDDEIAVRIDSPGGSALDGVAIAHVIGEAQRAGIKVTGHIVGRAASAASLVAIACDPLLIAPTGRILIHGAHLTTNGRSEPIDGARAGRLADALARFDQRAIVDRYHRRSSTGTRADWAALVDQSTSFTAAEALTYGLADDVAPTAQTY